MGLEVAVRVRDSQLFMLAQVIMFALLIMSFFTLNKNASGMRKSFGLPG